MIAFLVPLPVLLAAQFVSGTGLAIHLALWFTVFQQQVPEEARSRVSSYDALGSFVLIPLGTASPGPIAAGVRRRRTLLAGRDRHSRDESARARPTRCLKIGSEPAPASWKR